MQHIITPIWPTWKELSDDLGLPYMTVWSWKARNRIPSEYDVEIIAAAKKRGGEISLEMLADARASRRKSKREAV